jgi:ADP-heptose:LPS heptosyltransferase
VLSTGVIRAICEAHRSLKVDVLTAENNIPVYDNNPFVHDVIPFEFRRPGELKRVRPRLRSGGYAAAIDGHADRSSTHTQTMRLMLATGAPYRIGPGDREESFFYTMPCRPAPAGAHHLDVLATLAQPFDVPPGVDWRPRLYVSEVECEEAERLWLRAAPSAALDRAPRVLVNISAAYRCRRWPNACYREVVAHVRSRLPGAAITVLATPNEKSDAEQIALPSGGLAVSVGLRQVFAIVGSADLLISPDTGVAHVASCFGTPTVAFLLSTRMHFAPYRTPGRGVVSAGDSLEALTVERVLPTVDEVLEETIFRRAGAAPTWELR